MRVTISLIATKKMIVMMMTMIMRQHKGHLIWIYPQHIRYFTFLTIYKKTNKNAKILLQYLGKLDVVSGYTLFDEGEVLSVLGIHTNTFVFPGFILPLVMQNQSEHAAMVRFVETKNIFVLMCAE